MKEKKAVCEKVLRSNRQQCRVCTDKEKKEMKEGEGIKNSSKAYLSKDICNNKTVVYAGVGGCHTLSE